MKKMLFLMSLSIVFCSCSFKFGNNEISFMQMQIRQGTASIYSTKLYGANIEVPIPMVGNVSISPARFQIGYVGETKGIIPIKENGELPNVLIDLSTTHGSNSSDLSDTYATGDATLTLYPEETTDLPPIK